MEVILENVLVAGGCFKCGAIDHYAKDCDGSKDGKKYVLKDENIQRGSHNSQKYLPFSAPHNTLTHACTCTNIHIFAEPRLPRISS